MYDLSVSLKDNPENIFEIGIQSIHEMNSPAIEYLKVMEKDIDSIFEICNNILNDSNWNQVEIPQNFVKSILESKSKVKSTNLNTSETNAALIEKEIELKQKLDSAMRQNNSLKHEKSILQQQESFDNETCNILGYKLLTGVEFNYDMKDVSGFLIDKKSGKSKTFQYENLLQPEITENLWDIIKNFYSPVVNLD